MFKKIKSLFIIEDEQGNRKPASENVSAERPADKKAREPQVPFEKPVYTRDNPPQGEIDEKFVNRLLGAIEEHNMEGFDYLEYKQALQNLKTVEMDEATKYTSALAVAQTMGANKAGLEESAVHYLRVLEKEEKKFQDAFQNQVKLQVLQQDDRIAGLEKSIQEKLNRIEKLKQEIAAEREELEKQKSSIEAAKQKVEATKDGFYQAYHIVSEQIREDLEKIRKYLD